MFSKQFGNILQFIICPMFINMLYKRSFLFSLKNKPFPFIKTVLKMYFCSVFFFNVTIVKCTIFSSI